MDALWQSVLACSTKSDLKCPSIYAAERESRKNDVCTQRDPETKEKATERRTQRETQLLSVGG